MSVEENKALVRRYYRELLSGGDLSFVDRYMAPEFKFTNPTHPSSYRGREFKQLVKMLHDCFPDLEFTVQHLIAEGNVVVGHWIARGTHTGTPLKTLRGDIPAQGKPFEISGVSWLRIINGKFVEATISEDTLGLLRQLGALPGLDLSSLDLSGFNSATSRSLPFILSRWVKSTVGWVGDSVTHADCGFRKLNPTSIGLIFNQSNLLIFSQADCGSIAQGFKMSAPDSTFIF